MDQDRLGLLDGFVRADFTHATALIKRVIVGRVILGGEIEGEGRNGRDARQSRDCGGW